MNFRAKAPETRTISEFKVPRISFRNSAKGTMYFHHETPNIGAVQVFWLIPIQKHQQAKAFQALAAVEMLLSGGDGKSEQEILSYIEHLGASVGNDSEYLYAKIHFRCAKAVVFDVFSWILHHIENASYPIDELQRYILVKKASLERKMQTPGYWSAKKAKQLLYADLPWIGDSGSLHDFDLLTSDDLKEFHTANILNAGGALFFSGDISTEQVNALLHVWESYPRKDFEWKLPEEGLPEGILFEDEITHLVPNTSQLSMRWAKHIGALDENKIHEFTLLNMVFGGYFGSRLMQELRERQGLTYGIHSYFEPLWKGRTWYLSGEMNSDNESKAMQGIKEIMYQLQNERIPQEELERAKKYYSGLFRSGFDGPFSQATKSSQILVRKYSDTFFSNTLETIWNVDSEQLLQLAQNELDPKTFVRVIAGDTN